MQWHQPHCKRHHTSNDRCAGWAHVVSFQSHIRKTRFRRGVIRSHAPPSLRIVPQGLVRACTVSGGWYAEPLRNAVHDDVVRHHRLDVPDGLDRRRRRHGGLQQGAAAALPCVRSRGGCGQWEVRRFRRLGRGQERVRCQRHRCLAVGGPIRRAVRRQHRQLGRKHLRRRCRAPVLARSVAGLARPLCQRNLLGSVWRAQRRACRRRRRVLLGPVHAARHRRRRVRQFGFEQHQHDLDRAGVHEHVDVPGLL